MYRESPSVGRRPDVGEYVNHHSSQNKKACHCSGFLLEKLKMGFDLGLHKVRTPMKRFFRSLKSARVNYRRYQTRRQAIADIIDYIEPFYNQKLRHFKLGNISLISVTQIMAQHHNEIEAPIVWHSD